MTGRSRTDTPNLLEKHDWKQYDSVCDIGGGKGHLLIRVL